MDLQTGPIERTPLPGPFDPRQPQLNHRMIEVPPRKGAEMGGLVRRPLAGVLVAFMSMAVLPFMNGETASSGQSGHCERRDAVLGLGRDGGYSDWAWLLAGGPRRWRVLLR